eukprot:gene19466-23309_t
MSPRDEGHSSSSRHDGGGGGGGGDEVSKNKGNSLHVAGFGIKIKDDVLHEKFSPYGKSRRSRARESTPGAYMGSERRRGGGRGRAPYGAYPSYPYPKYPPYPPQYPPGGMGAYSPYPPAYGSYPYPYPPATPGYGAPAPPKSYDGRYSPYMREGTSRYERAVKLKDITACACRYGRLEMVKLMHTVYPLDIIDDYYPVYFIELAAARNHIDVVRFIHLNCRPQRIEWNLEWVSGGTVEIFKYFESIDGIYCDTKQGLKYIGNKVIVPKIKSIINRVISLHHDGRAGHHGVEKTLSSIEQVYVWDGMKSDVKRYIKACTPCARGTDHTGKSKGKSQPLQLPVRCFESISMDFVHLQRAFHKEDYFDQIWVIVDRLSKFVRLIPVKKTATAQDLAELFMKEIFTMHGMPSEIISDSDSKFTSAFWKELMDLLHTKIRASTADNQQANGQVERYVRTISNMLRKLALDDELNDIDSNWITHIDTVEFCLNNTKQGSTQMTPFMIYTGQNPITPLTLFQCSQVKDMSIDVERLIEDKRHTVRLENVFTVGDKVLLKRKRSGSVKQKRLAPRWDGPYEVIAVVGLLVTIKDYITGKDKQITRKKFSRHARYFKLFRSAKQVARDARDVELICDDAEEDEDVPIIDDVYDLDDDEENDEVLSEGGHENANDDDEMQDVEDASDVGNSDIAMEEEELDPMTEGSLVLSEMVQPTNDASNHDNITALLKRVGEMLRDNRGEMSSGDVKKDTKLLKILKTMMKYIGENKKSEEFATKQSAQLIRELLACNRIKKENASKFEYLVKVGKIVGWVKPSDMTGVKSAITNFGVSLKEAESKRSESSEITRICVCAMICKRDHPSGLKFGQVPPENPICMRIGRWRLSLVSSSEATLFTRLIRP